MNVLSTETLDSLVTCGFVVFCQGRQTTLTNKCELNLNENIEVKLFNQKLMVKNEEKIHYILKWKN